MTSRTALAVGLACVMAAACSSVSHATSGAAVQARQSAEPFGLIVLPLTDEQLKKKWSALAHDLGDDKVQLALCDGDRTGCASSSAINFLAIVDRAKKRDGLARVGEINRSVNLAIRPVSDLAQYGLFDAWKSALVTFFRGAGDCEDYAVAKYVALREAGVPADKLRIVIVRDELRGGDHAVAAIWFDGRWLILDNRRMAIVEDSYARHYRPLFVFNEDGIWKYERGSTFHAARRAGWEVATSTGPGKASFAFSAAGIAIEWSKKPDTADVATRPARPREAATVTVSMRPAEHERKGHDKKLRTDLVGDVHDPTAPVFSAACHDERTNHARGMVTCFVQVVDRGAALID